ncbi:MAG: hypothetical protein K6L76_07655 [Agarilytica sp.]
MLKKIVTSALVLTSIFIASLAIAGPRIAVMDFDNRAQHGGWRIGQGAADMLTTELVKATDFEIFERARLASVMEEQNLGAGGRIDPSTAARIGKIIGVQYIITGAVTEYGQSSSGGGGAGVHVGKKGYAAAVDIRIVNATTGRIVFAESGEGRKTSMNVRVLGIGGGEKWNEKHATKSMRMAIQEVSKKIAKADLTAGGKSSGSGGPIGDVKVADVEGNILTLNKGENAGLKKGDVLVVKRQRKVIKDPETGAVLKIKYTKLGKIKVTEVDDSYSEATVIEGSGFQAGDSVASK